MGGVSKQITWKFLDQVLYRTGGCLLRSLRLSGLIGSSLEVKRVLGTLLLLGCSAVRVHKLSFYAADELFCSGAWYHVGAFIPL